MEREGERERERMEREGGQLFMFLEQTYKPYTLVWPTVTRLVQDPLAGRSLNNRLYILYDYRYFSWGIILPFTYETMIQDKIVKL